MLAATGILTNFKGILSVFSQTEPPNVKRFIKKRLGRKLADKIFWEDVMPRVGSLEMSYANFLDMLEQRLVRRIHILADGNVALVEVQFTSTGLGPACFQLLAHLLLRNLCTKPLHLPQSDIVSTCICWQNVAEHYLSRSAENLSNKLLWWPRPFSSSSEASACQRNVCGRLVAGSSGGLWV